MFSKSSSGSSREKLVLSPRISITFIKRLETANPLRRGCNLIKRRCYCWSPYRGRGEEAAAASMLVVEDEEELMAIGSIRFGARKTWNVPPIPTSSSSSLPDLKPKKNDWADLQ